MKIVRIGKILLVILKQIYEEIVLFLHKILPKGTVIFCGIVAFIFVMGSIVWLLGKYCNINPFFLKESVFSSFSIFDTCLIGLFVSLLVGIVIAAIYACGKTIGLCISEIKDIWVNASYTVDHSTSHKRK